jgi:tetratricopeptide (TPR) repeat protein/Zn-dependent protease
MSSLLYAIAILLVALALPYLIAGWNIRHTVMRCMRIEPDNVKDLPDHLQVIFKAAIAELKPYGFKVVSCHQIEQGSEKDGKQWGILLQHSSGQIYAGLMTSQLISNTAPLLLTFMTFFEDETQLITTNSSHAKIFSSFPQEIAQNLGNVAIAEQWQAHQQKLAELVQTKQPQNLNATAFIEKLKAHNKRAIERLVKTREVSWVKRGESYHINLWTAVRAVYLVGRKNKLAGLNKSKTHAVVSSTSAYTTPIIELEITEFHRLQQKQKDSLSQRGKHWLLLGTLALFIVSYSPILEPQKLLIFVAVLLLHEGGHVLAMKIFGYRNPVMLFIPFLGALATARKENASLTEKVWISLAGPLPGLILGIGVAIAFSIPDLADPTAAYWFEESNWIRETIWMLIILNLFNLLPIYPLDGGQVADLLVFSRNPYVGVIFKGIGVALLGLLGLMQPLLLVFAGLIALTIPVSFRLAKLKTRFARDLRKQPDGDRDGLLRYLFTQLQASPYQALPFSQKYTLVVGILDTWQADMAKWTVRVSLIGIYLISLLTGLAGGLYALVPNWTAWTTMVSTWIDPQGSYRHRMQQHMESANRTLQTHPNDVQAYLQRGRAKLALKDYEGAIADANQILQINPQSGEAYHLRAYARRRTGDQAGATADREKGTVLIAQQHLNELNQKLGQHPQDIEAYLERADAYYILKRYREAIADSNRALRIDPQNITAVLSRGRAYLALKQYPEALGNANHALRLDPNSGDAYEFRGQVRRQMGDKTGAIADEQKAEMLFQNQEDED